jgi:alkyl hydroperoxide reductase subunit AhpC/tRNA A-37 threonylcarbamoyl transferase component Bud32
VTLSNFHDKWLILAFYPRDFSLVCPTELTALSVRMDEFRQRGCDVLGISTDSLESHEQWITTPPAQRGLGGLQFPLAADVDGIVSRTYGVYLEQQRIALRGLFIIDPNGVLQYQVVHNLTVGRRSEEIMRILSALESGGLCPEDWCADCETLDSTQSLGPGSVISHYRIEEKVGEGTFAAVFRARDTVLERRVALKVFKPGGLSNPISVLTEARSEAALNHTNICTVFAIEDGEGVPIIAMEFLDGRPLAAMLEEGTLPAERVKHLAHQIARGMAAAHRKGIAHGDLKPANIMIIRHDAVKITDFGLSRRIEPPKNDEKTQEWSSSEKRRIAGTPNYMSPEQTRGEAVTPASDLFAFGVMLYEMLTGRKPFAGDNVLQLFSEIRRVDPARFAGEVPEPFADILRGTLMALPAERKLTMETIAKRLE